MVLQGKKDNFRGVNIIADEAWPNGDDVVGFKADLEVGGRVGHAVNDPAMPTQNTDLIY